LETATYTEHLTTSRHPADPAQRTPTSRRPTGAAQHHR
jgi:hypothetical protein